jgi:hypothetical protein
MSSLRILLSDPSKLQRDCQGAFERAVEFAAGDYRGLCLRERRWSSGHRWGGAVDFELGAGRCSGDVNVILKAPTTSVAHAQLLVAAAFRNSTRQILAQASDAKVVYVTPALSYLLATTTNPTQPGQVPPNGSLITGEHGSDQRRFDIPYCGCELSLPRVKGSTRHADDWCWLIPYLSRL